MKMNFTALCLVVGLSTTSFAETPESMPSNTQLRPRFPTPSCDPIEAACKTAGFVAGGYKVNNGLWAHCIGPIMNGKKVDNVAIDPAWNLTGCKSESMGKKAVN